MLRMLKFLPLMVLVLLWVPQSHAAVQNRITQAIDASRRTTLRGQIHPLVRTANDQGQIADSTVLPRILLMFKRSAAQQADLDTLLAQQQDPSSPNYHKWLTPAQYADRFGLSSADLSQVENWLSGQGFKIVEAPPSRSYIAISGTAAQVRAAFQTPIHQLSVNGKTHYANLADPSLPAALADVVLGIHGLNNFRLRPQEGVIRRIKPNFTSSISGNHFIVPDDFATIYNLKPLYSQGIDGTGQKIAVVGQTDLVMSDIATFRSLSGLPANNPQVVLVPGSTDPGVVSSEMGEADLDVEWAGAVAENATLIYVNSGNGVFDALQYAISQNIAPVVSISYGDCEPNWTTADLNSLVASAQQANAQGMTIVGPTGDTGAADCDYSTSPNVQITSARHGLAVDVPASIPNVTGVGGTTLNEGSVTYWSATNNTSNGSALSYIPEVAWNDTAYEIANGGSLAASGGGASTIFAKPSWQTGTGVPNDNARDVPDVAFSASFDNDGYLICSQSSCVNGYRAADNTLYVVGGTSVGAPVFAGIVALINQQTQSAQGNVNPRLYQLASLSSDALHDVQTGDNKVPCVTGTANCPNGGEIGYSAGVGYDPVTGLGSVNGYNLVMEWNASSLTPTPDFEVSTAVSSVTVSAGSPATDAVTVAAENGFSGAVSLTCTMPAGLSNATCTVTPNTIAGSGTATLTVTKSASAALHAPPAWPRSWPWTGGSFALAFGLVIGEGMPRSKRKLLALLSVVALASLLTLAGCGGGSSNPVTSATTTTTTSSATSGVVAVQATSGSITHTTQVSVTVQ